MARGWKFRIQKEEELCYLCSENKGADQLCGYHFAIPCERFATVRDSFAICAFVFAYAKSRFSHDADQVM